MRAVIFGCGYVGASLAEAAVKSGWEVWVLTRNAMQLAVLDSIPDDRKVVADLHSRDWHACLNGDFDVAWNLVSSAGGGLEGYRLSYLEGNRSIAEWAAKRRLGHFIYTSATSVYPQTDGEWVDEAAVPEREFLSASGEILRSTELEIESRSIAEKQIVLRLGGIYGPGRHLYLDRLRDGVQAIPGDGSGWLNLIYRDDIVDVLMKVASTELEGFSLFNVIDDQPSRKQDILDWLAKELNLPAPFFDPHLVTARTARRTIGGQLPNRRVSNAAIREALSWAPAFPSYREGYRAIIKALKL